MAISRQVVTNIAVVLDGDSVTLNLSRDSASLSCLVGVDGTLVLTPQVARVMAQEILNYYGPVPDELFAYGPDNGNTGFKDLSAGDFEGHAGLSWGDEVPL